MPIPYKLEFREVFESHSLLRNNVWQRYSFQQDLGLTPKILYFDNYTHITLIQIVAAIPIVQKNKVNGLQIQTKHIDLHHADENKLIRSHLLLRTYTEIKVLQNKWQGRVIRKTKLFSWDNSVLRPIFIRCWFNVSSLFLRFWFNITLFKYFFYIYHLKYCKQYFTE